MGGRGSTAERPEVYRSMAQSDPNEGNVRTSRAARLWFFALLSFPQKGGDGGDKTVNVLVIPDSTFNSRLTSECSGPQVCHLENGHRGAFAVVFHG